MQRLDQVKQLLDKKIELVTNSRNSTTNCDLQVTTSLLVRFYGLPKYLKPTSSSGL